MKNETQRPIKQLEVSRRIPSQWRNHDSGITTPITHQNVTLQLLQYLIIYIHYNRQMDTTHDAIRAFTQLEQIFYDENIRSVPTYRSRSLNHT